jgi:hypothetical protein
MVDLRLHEVEDCRVPTTFFQVRFRLLCSEGDYFFEEAVVFQRAM